MKDLIKREAADLGFALVGFTTAHPVDQKAYLAAAISEGRIGTMNWLARDPAKRCDPASLLPGARSVICCALQYGEKGIRPLPATPATQPTNVIARSEATKQSPSAEKRKARFARGLDYHKVVHSKLEELWDNIKQRAPDAHAKFCVDTSPILEKALAARAGVGWIGKHTILINEKLGSWFVLGEIITDLKIEPDEPAKDLCADCTLCINACPTNALKASHTLDANLCVSYLTVEHKGKVPSHMRQFIPEGAYGCDICQTACPYNVNK